MSFKRLAARGFVVPTRLQSSLASSYESASGTGSRVRNWNPSAAGPNSAATSGLALQRRRSRDAVRNDPWAKTAAARWVSNVIGAGIQPYPQHPDKEVRLALKQLWADWTLESDADGRLDFYGQQVLAAQSLFVDGETLGRFRYRRPEDGLAVPLQLQLYEGDQLPVEYSTSLANGAEIVSGVEFDAIGRRTAYHLWTRHPGEFGRAAIAQELRRVPADQMVHAFKVLRPGQVRGVTELAAVLLRLKSVDNFDDAVLYRQEISNLFAGFIKKTEVEGSNLDPLTGEDAEYDDDGTPVASLEPGTMSQLFPNEDVTFSSPPDAGDNYEGFLRQQLMAAFASVGIPYELASGDLRGVSDRTLRVLVNEFHRLVEQYQWTVFIHQFCRPIWAAWIDTIALSGILPMPDFHRNRRAWLRVRWVPQGWPYFNPVQDIAAKTSQVRAGFKSRASVVLEQGDDPDTTLDEIIADGVAADEAGQVFDSDARKTTPTGKAVAEPDAVTT